MSRRPQSAEGIDLLTRRVHQRGLAYVLPTLGPGQMEKGRPVAARLRGLIKKGVAVFRINLSHFDVRSDKYREEWTDMVQTLWAEARGASIGIMLDTCGPEFRTRVQHGAPGITGKPGDPVFCVEEGEDVVLYVPPAGSDDASGIGPFRRVKEDVKILVAGMADIERDVDVVDGDRVANVNIDS